MRRSGFVHGTSKQVDNAHLKVKLDLREYFLKKYHADEPPRVLDCCQASGTIWKALREHYEVKSYWGLDKAKKRGRLVMDSTRVVATSVDDVVDIDTYGSPWKHLLFLLDSPKRPVTVFLTFGSSGMNGAVDLSYRTLLGLGSVPVPMLLLGLIARGEPGIILGLEGVRAHGWEVEDVMVGGRMHKVAGALYVGLRLVPK